MSTVTHNAIIVTSWDVALLDELVAHTTKLGATVVGPSAEVVNGYKTVVVVPDGSKTGWHDDVLGDTAREAVRGWLNERRYSDGSTALEWVEVAYGNDLSTGAYVVTDATRDR